MPVYAIPVCRVCGCHADDACRDPSSPTGTCYWVEGDLCSKRKGFQVLVLGGEHKDAPLDPAGGVKASDVLF